MPDSGTIPSLLTNTASKEEPPEQQGLASGDEVNASTKRWQAPPLPPAVRYLLIALANLITSLNFASGVAAIVLVGIDPRNVTYTLWAARLILLAVLSLIHI